MKGRGIDDALALARAVRFGEAVLMVGFPTAAGVLGMTAATKENLLRLVPVLAAAVPIALSIYAFNTAVGFADDIHDPKFASNPLHRGRVRRRTLFVLTGVGAAAGFLVLGLRTPGILPTVITLWLVWLVYSHPRGLKGRPVLPTMAHLVAGCLMFLVPYGAERPLDARGIALALFFGLALASGHANHEALDEPADRAAGVTTFAVRAGRRRAVDLNLVLAGIAYLLLAAATLGRLIEPVVAAPFLAAAVVHLGAGRLLFHGTPSTGDLQRYRTVYRTAFALATVLALAGHLWLLEVR